MLHAIGSIILQLMVPFVVGHLARPLIGKWVDRHRKLINLTDRSSILLVVYTAFSAAVVEGIWHRIDGWSLLTILVMSLVLLTVVLVINTYAARWLGFNTADGSPSFSAARKEPGERHPDGQRAVPGCGGGRHGAAADDFPPGAADGVRGAGAALCA